MKAETAFANTAGLIKVKIGAETTIRTITNVKPSLNPTPLAMTFIFDSR